MPQGFAEFWLRGQTLELPDGKVIASADEAKQRGRGLQRNIAFVKSIARRAKLIHRLEQQKQLALDPNFVPSVSKWVRNEAGTKELVKLQKRVRPWWREDVLGTIDLTVRYGSKAIEFEKGKTAIAVPNKEQLIATIDTVISAVRAGELDEHLTQQAKERGVSKLKRSA